MTWLIWLVVTGTVTGLLGLLLWCWDELLTDREVRERWAEADARYLERSRALGPEAYLRARRDVADEAVRP